jgi:hypothetical protein
MSEPPDLANLAQRYVALWQDYLTTAAADPELADTLTRLLTGMGTVAGAWTRPPWFADMQPPRRRAAEDERAPDDAKAAKQRDGERAADRSEPDGAAPAAVAPAERDGGVDELHGRIVLLERRIAALEADARSRTRQRGPGAGGTARRRRS